MGWIDKIKSELQAAQESQAANEARKASELKAKQAAEKAAQEHQVRQQQERRERALMVYKESGTEALLQDLSSAIGGKLSDVDLNDDSYQRQSPESVAKRMEWDRRVVGTGREYLIRDGSALPLKYSWEVVVSKSFIVESTPNGGVYVNGGGLFPVSDIPDRKWRKDLSYLEKALDKAFRSPKQYKRSENFQQVVNLDIIY